MPLFLLNATDRLASVGHIGSCRFPRREGGTFLLHFPVRQACTFFLLRYNGGIRKPQGDGRRPPPSAGRRAAPAGFGCAETACGRRVRFSGGCGGTGRRVAGEDGRGNCRGWAGGAAGSGRRPGLAREARVPRACAGRLRRILRVAGGGGGGKRGAPAGAPQ